MFRFKAVSAILSFVVVLSTYQTLAQSDPANILVGATNVHTLSSYQGSEPLPKPDKTVIYDFAVPADAITMDRSAGARLLGHGPLARLRGEPQDTSPEAVIEHVQASFAKAFIKELQKTSIPTERFENAGTTMPMHTLVVSGEFTLINQGNKSKRIMIGFGRGASDVQAHVKVSLTTDKVPIVVSEFELNSASGKKPGAAATMGVGSAAGSVAGGGVGDQKETVEGDASRMANAVAKQIETLMISQKWIPAQPAQDRQSASSAAGASHD
jgi:hypothetical protein